MTYSTDDKYMLELEHQCIEQLCVKILRETDDPKTEEAGRPAELQDEKDRLWRLLVQAAKN